MEHFDPNYGHTINIVWSIHDIWSSFIGDVSAILADLPERTFNAGGYFPRHSTLCTGPKGGEPILAFNGMAFKGLVDHADANPFFLTPEPGAYTIITGRLPYDFAVTAALIALQDLAADRVCIATSGSRSDWLHAVEFMHKHSGVVVDLGLFNHQGTIS